MFGYVKTDIPNMFVKDTVLYKAMYCGLCKGIGETCGLKGRMTLSYDLTFLSVFLHNLKGIDVSINKQRCVLHWLIRKPMAKVDDITRRIGALNVILAYYKCKDDVTDNNGGRLKSAFFKSSYKRAKKLEPKLDKIVEENFNKLLKLEKDNCDSIDIAADPFGNLLCEVVKELSGEDFAMEVKALSYNLGKWIYLIDAIDDYDKDKKKKSYNVFINSFKCDSKDELLTKNEREIQAIFSVILSDIITASNNIKYKFNHDLTDNIIKFGLIKETKKVMEKKR